MRISVLIAAFQARAFLPRALEGLIGQWHSDWELVVVEDGSSDGTEQLVADFADRVRQPVRYVQFERNEGVAVARSRLLAMACGEAVAFLDADDWWSPHHLHRLHSAFAAGGDVVVSGIELYDLDLDLPRERYTPPSLLFTRPVDALLEESCIMTASSVGLRRTLADRVGEFDPAFRIGEDRDYWLRCALAGARFAHSGDVTCHYSKHAKSSMAQTLFWARQEVAFYEKYRDLRIPGSRGRARWHLAHCLENFGRLQRASDPLGSTRTIFRAWTVLPWKPSLVPQLIYSAGAAVMSGRAGFRNDEARE